MKWYCRRCGDEIILDTTNLNHGLCSNCQKDDINIDKLRSQGHTLHCACRMTFGDGECECYCDKSGLSRKEQAERIIEVIKNET